jgi:hypothetical protein
LFKIEADKTDLKQRTGSSGYTKKQDLRVKKGPSGQKKGPPGHNQRKGPSGQKRTFGSKKRTGHLVLNWLEEKKIYNNFSVGPDLSLLTNPDEGPT